MWFCFPLFFQESMVCLLPVLCTFSDNVFKLFLFFIFFTVQFVFLLFEYLKRLLYACENLLSYIWFTIVFKYNLPFSFSFLNNIFSKNRPLITWWNSICSFFYSAISKKSLHNLRPQNVLLYFLTETLYFFRIYVDIWSFWVILVYMIWDVDQIKFAYPYLIFMGPWLKN